MELCIEMNLSAQCFDFLSNSFYDRYQAIRAHMRLGIDKDRRIRAQGNKFIQNITISSILVFGQRIQFSIRKSAWLTEFASAMSRKSDAEKAVPHG
jgi:hypothetical protein